MNNCPRTFWLVSFLFPPSLDHSYVILCNIFLAQILASIAVLPLYMCHLLTQTHKKNLPSLLFFPPHSATPDIACTHGSISFQQADLEDCVRVCAVVSAWRVNRMMSKRRASNLIKKEIKVDVCYFQLRHSAAICQSQRCDCFGPTVIHCLSKY